MSEENQNEPMPGEGQSEQKSGFSQEQYEMLKRCSEKGDMVERNEWQREHYDEPILLQGANFAAASVQGVQLHHANLRGPSHRPHRVAPPNSLASTWGLC